MAQRKRLIMIFAIAVIIVVILAIIFSQIIQKSPLTRVNGGISWTLNDLNVSLYQSWDNMFVTLHFGNDDIAPNVVWNLSSDFLVGNGQINHGFGVRNLSNLLLNLSVIDSTGNGVVDSNDTITFIAVNSTNFSSDAIYRIAFGWKSFDAGGWMEVSFEFHDKNLKSWISKEYHVTGR